MNAKNFVGAAACIVIFAAAFLVGQDAWYFFNGVGFIIVISGTLGATLLSCPFDQLTAAARVAINSYTARPPKAHRIIEMLLDLALKSRRDGVFSLQQNEREVDIQFLKDALGMLVDGFPRGEIREFLNAETRFFALRRQRHERTIRHMARLAPAFGVAGSVVGLIGMLTGIGDTSVILQTIPLALTSTLYGILLGNLVLVPIAENIHAKTQQELLMHELVIEGVTAIMEEQNSHRLERKLKSFVTPSSRSGRELSLQEIRQKYYELRLDQPVADSGTPDVG